MRLHAAAAGAILMLALSSCAAGPAEPPAITPEVPAGFEEDDLFPPDLWVSDPVHGGSECGDGELFDCWTVTVMSETGCDPYALLTFVERNASGQELERYQQAAAAEGAGKEWEFSWDSQWHAKDVIDSIEVIDAGCTEEL